MAILEGSNMVFVTAGMGGGTGTGAAPVIAQMAREAGILTVGVITKPFHFEGSHRMKLAEAGIAELQKHVDTLIIIPNQNLFRIANEKTTFSDAFKMADEVLQSGVRGVTDLMVMPGLINLDFADIRAVMAEMGKAMMGTGEAAGDRRAVEAAEAAISNPLLDDISMKGARGVLINITGGLDMTLFEVDDAANRVRDEVDPDANIIFGSTFNEEMQGKMRVSVVATGIEVNAAFQAQPLHIAAQAVEPSRRPAAAPASSRPGYAGRKDFSPGGVPSSVMPAYTTMSTARPVMSQQGAAPTVAGQREQCFEPQVAVGHAAATAYAATATARKLDEADAGVDNTHTKLSQTQSIQRPASSPASQPRAQRHGNSFIPPKPVDPRVAQSMPDLFDEKTVSAQPRATQAAEKPVKKSPSLFERFTMQRQEEPHVAAPSRPESSPQLSVEAGGKQDEDELDIPAFLRRQAN